MATKYFTFRSAAAKAKKSWQRIKFLAGKGYFLVGHPPAPKPAPPSQAVFMFDSVDITQIPPDARAVAGYVNGKWPTFLDLIKHFPNAHKVSIDVNGSNANADCLDVEKGDATNEQAAAWVKKAKSFGVARPIVYTSLSNVPALLLALNNGGVSRAEIRLWTAHYTYVAHRCGPNCGLGMKTVADATQYDDHARGKNLDQSLLSTGFFQT